MAPHPKNPQVATQQISSPAPSLTQATVFSNNDDKNIENKAQIVTNSLPSNSSVPNNYSQLQNHVQRGVTPMNIGNSYLPGGGMYGGGMYGGGMYGGGYSPFGYGMNMGYGASSGMLGTIYSLQHMVALCGQLIHVIGANSNSFAFFVQNMFHSVKEIHRALLSSGKKYLI